LPMTLVDIVVEGSTMRAIPRAPGMPRRPGKRA
jgi:hypothetical protein